MTVKYTETSLAKVDVEIVDYDRVILRCMDCGTEFSPMRKAEAKRMPRHWWRCPNGSNRPPRCALCEKGFMPLLGLVRACNECGTDYFLCFGCSEKFKGETFPCCLLVPGRRVVVPRSQLATSQPKA